MDCRCGASHSLAAVRISAQAYERQFSELCGRRTQNTKPSPVIAPAAVRRFRFSQNLFPIARSQNCYLAMKKWGIIA